MKSKNFFLGLLLLVATWSARAQSRTAPASRSAVLMGEDVISTPDREWTTTFTPDGNTVYFSRGLDRYVILASQRVKGRWQTPQVASFSGVWKDTDPFVTANGQRVYFCSNRPTVSRLDAKPDKNFHIWYADRLGQAAWSAPVCLDSVINCPGVSTWYPSESKNGDFYFHSWGRPGGHGKNDIYVSKHVGNKFSTPELIAVDTVGFSTQECRVSPDNKYIVFVSNRPGGYGASDLYIAFHKNGLWSKPLNLGPEVNLAGIATFAPALSLDEQTLYFVNGSVPSLAPSARIADYEMLLKQMNTVFNGLWNIFSIPIDIKALADKANWAS